tara:strand:- start:2157 stop:2960 length:804 start_codon:yes stop_codon:yes gene_type:complete
LKPRLGLFDSGVGGFTVLKRILEYHGNISCVYLGDTARLPYGSKNSAEIRLIAEEVVSWLKKQKVTAIVVACNTTNSMAMDIVEDLSGVPVFGLVNSAVEMISEKRVGVLSTPSTAASGAYKKHILRSHPNTFVIQQGCPGFVPMIEMGQINGDDLSFLAQQYLKPLLKAKVQSIILGCSHYPLLKNLLKQFLPSDVRLIDPAIGLARHLNIPKSLENVPTDLLNPLANTRFCVTSDPIGFSSRAKHWLGIDPKVELVSLRSKACVF